MSNIDQQSKQNSFPVLRSIYRKLRLFHNGILDLQYWDRQKHFLPGIGWYLNPLAFRSRIKMSGFLNRHKGERCFIVGNGPSLNHMDLSPLRNEITFGLNRIYLLFPKIGFQTTYLVSVNRLVIEQSRQELIKLPMTKFFSWHARDVLGYSRGIIYIRDAYDGSLDFSRNPALRIWEGGTVTYVALQLTFFMGFNQVILIGVDHNFQTKGVPHQEVISRGSDPDHFDPGYFGQGFRWQLPDLAMSEKSYLLSKNAFEDDGREILDATVDGKLTIFEKVDFNTLF